MLLDVLRGLRFLFINQRFPPSFLKILRALQHKRISTLFQQRFLKYLHVTSKKKKVATIYGLLSPYMVYLLCLQRFSLRCEISVLKVAQPLCLFTISPTKKTSVIFFFYFKKFKVLFILFPHLFSNRETLQCSCCWIQKLLKVHLGHSICLPQGRIQGLASIAWDTVRFSEN